MVAAILIETWYIPVITAIFVVSVIITYFDGVKDGRKKEREKMEKEALERRVAELEGRQSPRLDRESQSGA